MIKDAIAPCRTCWLQHKSCNRRHPVCDTCATNKIDCHYAMSEGTGANVRQKEMEQHLKTTIENVETTPSLTEGETDEDVTELESDSSPTSNDSDETILYLDSEIFLVSFYIEYAFPFLFPFYRSCPLEGGKLWLLGMATSSLLIRQVIFCQGSYFFALKTIAVHVEKAYHALIEGLKDFANTGIEDHLPKAIAASRFEKFRFYLNTALHVFREMLGTTLQGLEEPRSSFDTIIDLLGAPPLHLVPAQRVSIPSAKQTGFRFSSALMIFDDIICSIILEQEPRLYECLPSLLGNKDDVDPPINIASVIGCRNWAILQIAEISMLNAWKNQCKRAGITDPKELYLAELESDIEPVLTKADIQLNIFPVEQPQELARQISLTTQVWTHTALLYLSLVVAEWQPAKIDLHFHASQIIRLLSCEISPAARVRTMAVPFYVAGCLAEPSLEKSVREMVKRLRPSSAFNTIHHALQIMEKVWKKRVEEDAANCDLSACFTGLTGSLLLLV
ncbi:fungal-specific transcription factor domain-containing protein [Annulohypoxylon moriforme]|nr:fungal-specific transcription factor domain-containing protein [Annulohypoxylon moriforme]